MRRIDANHIAISPDRISWLVVSFICSHESFTRLDFSFTLMSGYSLLVPVEEPLRFEHENQVKQCMLIKTGIILSLLSLVRYPVVAMKQQVRNTEF